jgi:carboxylesterase
MTRTPDDDQHPVLPGAEAFAADGGPHGVVALHGFTGNPNSMKGLAQAAADAGYAVECPRLPGHGTDVSDMLGTTWDDYVVEAESALQRLRAKLPEGGRIVVAGLSMGGALTIELGTRHPDLAGLVLVNAVAEPSGELRPLVEQAVADGTEVFPGIGSDIADPDAREISYEGTPLRPLLTMIDGIEAFQARLGSITCPALVLTSPQDHVVTPSNSDHIAAKLGGPVERVTLERSYHVATLDYDKDLIIERFLDFTAKVTTT